MSAPARGIPRELSIDDFPGWLDGRPETERWELIDGEPVRRMAPETVRHVELKRNVVEALRGGLRGGGLPCRAFGDGLAVRTGKRSGRVGQRREAHRSGRARGARSGDRG